jgi:hypothetical protein
MNNLANQTDLARGEDVVAAERLAHRGVAADRRLAAGGQVVGAADLDRRARVGVALVAGDLECGGVQRRFRAVRTIGEPL